MKLMINNIPVDIDRHYMSPVTYVPGHVNGNAGHKDCEQGVITDIKDKTITVLFCKSRTRQAVNPEDLVWG